MGTPCGESWNVLITGPPDWGFDVPLATALCKNLPAENTQQGLQSQLKKKKKKKKKKKNAPRSTQK